MQCKTCKWGQTGKDWTCCKRKCDYKYKQHTDLTNLLNSKLNEFENNVYITPTEYKAIRMFLKYIQETK